MRTMFRFRGGASSESGSVNLPIRRRLTDANHLQLDDAQLAPLFESTRLFNFLGCADYVLAIAVGLLTRRYTSRYPALEL
jgi:hypothetical protein